jgi:uncharacterized protein
MLETKTFVTPRRQPVAADVCVDQVILKLVQRCNLNCTYCYVYNRGDESWRTRPPIIRDAVLTRLGERIAEHCERHHMPWFTVELHGGEPLLLSKRRMRGVLDRLREGCGSVRLRLTLQTNGTRLDEEWLELFSEYGITFGVSLDGPPEAADRRRVMRSGGGGSTQMILDVIERLREQGPLFDELFGGCLCVVDPTTDGATVVDWFVDHGFSSFDFLLPDGNRVNPPQEWTGVEPYRRFLLSAFERWYSMGVRAPRIRKFELMMLGLTGADVPLDALGGDLRRLCVVESDGSIGVNDVARICGGEYSRDVLNIFDHTIDEHVSRYRIREIQRVCAQCQSCPYLASCGGGYLPHRFDGASFDNPSLYCDALYGLSERMMQALRDDLPPQFWTNGVPVGVDLAT